jgi:hypothetical protein
MSCITDSAFLNADLFFGHRFSLFRSGLVLQKMMQDAAVEYYS